MQPTHLVSIFIYVSIVHTIGQFLFDHILVLKDVHNAHFSTIPRRHMTLLIVRYVETFNGAVWQQLDGPPASVVMNRHDLFHVSIEDCFHVLCSVVFKMEECFTIDLNLMKFE